MHHISRLLLRNWVVLPGGFVSVSLVPSDNYVERAKGAKEAKEAKATELLSRQKIEVVTRQKNSGGCPCIKLDADHYIDIRTGEVMEYAHIENRSESTRSIRNTLARIRALVNTNVTAPANVRWVTITYAENMTDTVRLMKDYEKFWKKFLYFF